jgi:hypothetical protein
MKLYIDGCSLTHGQGLPRDKSLGHLFESIGKYQVTDFSRPGKSNTLISVDTYENYKNYDVFVLGFTFSERFGIKYQNNNLDFFPGFHKGGLALDSQDLDLAHIEVYKYFYTVFDRPYCDNFSDMLVDGLVSFLQSQSKTVIAFSWQPRSTQAKLIYPYIGPADRLLDGHLNEQGTMKLYNLLQLTQDE